MCSEVHRSIATAVPFVVLLYCVESNLNQFFPLLVVLHFALQALVCHCNHNPARLPHTSMLLHGCYLQGC